MSSRAAATVGVFFVAALAVINHCCEDPLYLQHYRPSVAVTEGFAAACFMLRNPTAISPNGDC